MKDKPSLFISRELRDDHIRQALLNHAHLHEISLINIQHLPIEITFVGDVYVYYSRNAVEAIYNSGLLENIKNNTRMHIGFGEGTSAVLQGLGLQNVFNGQANAPRIAAYLREQYFDQNIVFVRGSNSKKSVQKLVSDLPNQYEIIAYSNEPNTKIQALPDHQIGLLTSPMNAERYLEIFNVHPSVLVAIGPSTASVLKKKCNKVYTLNNPSEPAMLEWFTKWKFSNYSH